MQKLIECVPNFSEGRRPEVVAAIVEAIEAVNGAKILDYSADADHNRSVVTFVATPETVGQAAFAGIKMAAQQIDMTRHDGQHPRIGATDVCPFVPLRGVTLNDCAAIARSVGRRVGDELGIPVYLYEAAATRPERRNLADVRRGQYEGLRQAIKTDPARAPDFGPAELGSAGATAIGARDFLIAFNVYLATDQVKIAKDIARTIRYSNGGLRYVKAMGVLVKGKAQVSLNLTDFRRTPIHRALELIRREAARYGVAIESSELIGLTPQQALLDAAAWYLQLGKFDVGQVLESRLVEVFREK